MTADHDEYLVRAKVYRLLAAFPTQGAAYSTALDEALADPQLRDTLSALVGVAFAGYIRLRDGDVAAAIELVQRELRTAEDLAGLEG